MMDWLLVGFTGKVMVEFMGKVVLVVESKYMVLDMEYMAGIHQEETPTQKMLFFSSKLMTS